MSDHPFHGLSEDRWLRAVEIFDFINRLLSDF